MLNRLMALAGKEFIQVRRDKRTLAMMIALPLLWLVMFGYAFSFDVKEVKIAVIDNSGNQTGALVAKAFREYERSRVVNLADPTEAGIKAGMYRGEVQMGVIIPPGFAEGQTSPSLKVLFDGSELFAAQTGTRMLQKALEPVQTQIKADLEAKVKAAVTARGLDFTPPSAPQLIPQVETLYNPELKSANVMIPGLLGLVVMFMATLMTVLGIVREREYGTLEQLVVTPITPFELMLGKLIPPFIIAAVDFTLVYFLGSYLFNLTFVGNFPLFIGLSLLLVFTTLGLGLLLSTVAQNQQQAMQLAMFTVFPQILVSGLIFPLTSLPKWIQYVAYLLPFTHYVPIARGMFMKGQGLDQLMVPAVVLAVYSVAVLGLASLRFRKRLG
ncbi:MAG TPA: ABC transporter permease [Symbiobacteriaceae bacterium]|jgi:ABC-2 type transport system permease protein